MIQSFNDLDYLNKILVINFYIKSSILFELSDKINLNIYIDTIFYNASWIDLVDSDCAIQ